MTIHDALLPGLPAERIADAFAASPGDEIASGKFLSPESSAALAANVFGFFLDSPQDLPPPAPDLAAGWSPRSVRLEAELRFPWHGGRHPWLDALITTDDLLVGVESKRYEPFRSRPAPRLSDAYLRDVWGDRMNRYGRVRDGLKAGDLIFKALDAAQLVKHAYGLRTVVQPGAPQEGKRPVLLYLHATPARWPDGRAVDPRRIQTHASEVRRFAEMVCGDEVEFRSITYPQLIAVWRISRATGVAEHASVLEREFCLKAA